MKRSLDCFHTHTNKTVAAKFRVLRVRKTGDSTMKNIKNHLLLFAFSAFLLLPVNVFAGDYAALNFIGFSKDGKYLAFEEYGTQDGSGFPYANIYIVDAEKNSYPVAPVRKMFDESSMKVFDESKIPGEDQMRQKAKTAAAANLRKFRIIPGNTGRLVVARLLTDLDLEKLEPNEESNTQTVRFVEERLSNYAGNPFELRLTTAKANSKRCEDYYQTTLKFELGLKTNGDATENILQKDTTLPGSRGCPHDYSIQNVYLYENRIAVFMNVYTQGFEGPDMRYLVVTGNYR